MSSNKGFTLLEILIAVVLFGILSAALYGSYFTVLRGRETAAGGMEARRELGSTLDMIRREFAGALYSRDDKRLRLVVEDRDIFGKPASTLELTTAVPEAGQAFPESGIVTVRYRLVEKGKQLILTRNEQDVFFPAGSTDGYPQMEHISSFLVECFDGSKWVKSWDTALNFSLPKMLRVTVQVEEDGRPVEFTMLAHSRVRGQ